MKTKAGKIAKWVYRIILRPIIKKAIDDPNSELDDKILALLDKLFKYKT